MGIPIVIMLSEAERNRQGQNAAQLAALVLFSRQTLLALPSVFYFLHPLIIAYSLFASFFFLLSLLRPTIISWPCRLWSLAAADPRTAGRLFAQIGTNYPPLSTGLQIPQGVDPNAYPDAAIPYHRLYVTNLPWSLSGGDMRQVFEAFGEIQFVDMHIDFVSFILHCLSFLLLVRFYGDIRLRY